MPGGEGSSALSPSPSKRAHTWSFESIETAAFNLFWHLVTRTVKTMRPNGLSSSFGDVHVTWLHWSFRRHVPLLLLGN